MWAGLASAEEPPKNDGPARVTAAVVLKVANKEQAQRAVIKKAEEYGGYFSSLSDDAVAVRVPVDKADALLTYLAGLGLVADRKYQTEDLRERLSDQKTRLAARKKVLEQYFKILTTAKAKSVVTVEREITRLVAEVERYEGGIRLMEHDARLARIGVNFVFRDRTQPNRSHRSSFDWLNTLSVADLVKQFASVEDLSGPKNRVDVTLPKGFAAYDTRRQDWAASPDGVLFRVRTAQHEPEADLSFWAEAMSKHLDGAGYRVARDGAVKAGSVAGQFLETTAPLGAHDYAYAVAVFPNGKSLVLVEVAGPVEKFEARREAIVAAIQGLGF
jgi:hypothetical protein